MVVRSREARIRQELPRAPRSGRNGAKRRGEPFRVARQGRACRIVRSIRLPTATKEMPGNAAFVAPAAAFSVNRQAAIRPPGRISVAVSLQRVRRAHQVFESRQRQQAEVSRPARAGAAAVDGEGSARGGVSRAPLVPFLARSMRVWNGRGALKLGRKSPILSSGVGTSLAARPRFLEPELDSDPHLPGGPGPFHV